MKRGQMLGVAIAGVCGLGAFFGVKSLVNKPPTVVTQEVTTNIAQVLVAKTEIGLGQITGPENFRWQDWPQSAVNPSYIQRSARPNAIADLTGVRRARADAARRAGHGTQAWSRPATAACWPPSCPQGMRAISTRIKEETGVGKLILPNDHVDVILTMRRRGRGGSEDHVSDTLFRNIRVLAIGQLIEAAEGKKLAEGNTATLELTPKQAEELAAANSKGEISLILRSIADIKGGDEKDSNQVKIMRYGAKSRVYGVVN